MIMCPWCMGSKVPPKIPTLLISHPSRCCPRSTSSDSLEIELYLADPDLIPRLCPGPPERRHDTLSLKLPLEVSHTFRVLPVRPERESLDTLAGNLVGAVLDPLDPQPFPRGAEDAVLRGAGAISVDPGSLRFAHLPQSFLEEIPQLRYALAGQRRDLDGSGEGLPQILPQLVIQGVDLIEDHDRRLVREPGGVELGAQGALCSLGVFGSVEYEREEACPCHV